MDLNELRVKLEEAGCPPANYAIQGRGSDAYCLMNDGRQWKIFYSERGQDSEPIFWSESESEACEFFLGLMCKEANWHFVAAFSSEIEAKSLEEDIKKLGATPIRNDLPKTILGFTQYRIFVAGRDIHAVKHLQP